jgi:hypothetical protein
MVEVRSGEILWAKGPGKELAKGLDPGGSCDQEIVAAELEEDLSATSTGLQEVPFAIDADQCD